MKARGGWWKYKEKGKEKGEKGSNASYFFFISDKDNLYLTRYPSTQNVLYFHDSYPQVNY